MESKKAGEEGYPGPGGVSGTEPGPAPAAGGVAAVRRKRKPGPTVYQVDLTDQEWEYFQLIDDVEKVLRKLIKSEHMELPKDHEQMKVWAAELVGLALSE